MVIVTITNKQKVKLIFDNNEWAWQTGEGRGPIQTLRFLIPQRTIP